MTVDAAPVWAALPVLAALLAVASAGAVLDAALPGGAVGGGARAARPFAETARLLRQRRRTTAVRDGLLWQAGVAGPVVVAALMIAVVPFGGHVVADVPVGVVWFNAMDVCLWAVVWLAGWGPDSPYPLVGGYRYLAQALGYELPLMFALTAPAVAAGSLDVGAVVEAQDGLWFVVWMPVAFVVLLLGVAGFSLWGPFGAPGGDDVAGGVFAEASGVDRLLLLAGRYALLTAGAAMAVALFLGGGAGPWLPGWLWSLLKTLAVLGCLVVLRGRLPGLRPQVVVRLGWVVALPVVLLQVLAVSIVVVAKG
ncbi:complex I subunit 1 family protein [Streptomyces sp. GSL17-111]|uniref:complex I subunit 1 family protein n=1 Tax=Streptomyces sp. GSL17-111 TaxID=3121596 RepID=UPI0030F39E82